jgi:hypothetical protein
VGESLPARGRLVRGGKLHPKPRTMDGSEAVLYLFARRPVRATRRVRREISEQRHSVRHCCLRFLGRLSYLLEAGTRRRRRRDHRAPDCVVVHLCWRCSWR